jgi:hypothetical protein
LYRNILATLGERDEPEGGEELFLIDRLGCGGQEEGNDPFVGRCGETRGGEQSVEGGERDET